MKQKPDEALDQWVQQSLSRLPDSAPAGSSFDPERLWQQMRPELPVEQPHRRLSFVWWLSAAVVTGVLVLGGSLYWKKDPSEVPIAVKKQVKKEEQVVARVTESPANTGTLLKPITGLEEKEGLSRKVETKKAIPEAIMPNQMVNKPSEVASVITPFEPESTISRERGIRTPGTLTTTFPESETVLNVAVIANRLPEKQKPNVATTTSKRRFKVVHENELRAQEESAPQIYRTDNFVRLGTGQRNDNATDTRQPGLVMPLTSKSNQ